LNTEKLRPARATRTPGRARSVLPRAEIGEPGGAQAAGRLADAQGWSTRRRSEHALGALGLPTALDEARAAESRGDDRKGRRLREWLDLDPRALGRLVSPTRQLRLGLCGVAFVIRRDGVVGYLRRGCKDRVCPICSARRSRMIAARVQLHVASVIRAFVMRSRRLQRVEPVWSFTFTRRRVPGETPREAIDRTLNAWRGFSERTARGLLLGGMRSLEVTARRAGDIIIGHDGKQHRVEFGGTHAHLHTLLELAPGVTPDDVVQAWVAACDAEPWCQRPRLVWPGAGAIYQACKYPVDMSGLLDVLTAAPEYVAAVVRALHGRKVVSVFGGWRGVKLSGEEPGDGTVVFGDRAVVTLAACCPEDDDPVQWTDGTSTPALDVLRELIALGRYSPAAEHNAIGAVRRDPGVAVFPQEAAKGLGPSQVVVGGAGGHGIATQPELGHAHAGEHGAQLVLVGQPV